MNGERSENSEDEAVPIGEKERKYSLVPVKKRSDGLVADPALVVVLENVMRRLRAPQQPVKPALPSGHVEYQPPAPREVMEALKNGTPWIGVGMDARLRTAGLPRDAETVIAQLDKTWMNNKKPFIIIADSTLVHNIYARLWRKEKNWQDPHKDNPDKRDPKWRSDKQLMVVATKEAKIAGAQKKAYLEALHQIQSDSSSNAVYLMSEVLEGHEEFDVLFEKIRELVKNDPGLREKMWRCVPGVIREKVAKHVTSDTTFEEATAKSDSLL